MAQIIPLKEKPSFINGLRGIKFDLLDLITELNDKYSCITGNSHADKGAFSEACAKLKNELIHIADADLSNKKPPKTKSKSISLMSRTEPGEEDATT